jgi:hypothetical protein
MNEKSSNSRTIIIAIVAGLVLLCLCLLIVGVAGFLYFQTSRSETAVASPAVEYILDVSARMDLPAQGSPSTRLEIARGALAEMTRATSSDGQAGLRVFGSGAQPVACQDTALLLPLASGNQAQIANEVSDLQPGDARRRLWSRRWSPPFAIWPTATAPVRWWSSLAGRMIVSRRRRP